MQLAARSGTTVSLAAGDELVVTNTHGQQVVSLDPPVGCVPRQSSEGWTTVPLEPGRLLFDGAQA